MNEWTKISFVYIAKLLMILSDNLDMQVDYPTAYGFEVKYNDLTFSLPYTNEQRNQECAKNAEALIKSLSLTAPPFSAAAPVLSIASVLISSQIGILVIFWPWYTDIIGFQ